MKIREIYALGTEFIGSAFAYLAEVALLAIVAGRVPFRLHARGGAQRNRLFRAQWPIPETGETEAEAEEEIRLQPEGLTNKAG